jgi:hypothetical protein
MVAMAEIREQENGNNGNNNYTKTIFDQFTPEIQG